MIVCIIEYLFVGNIRRRVDFILVFRLNFFEVWNGVREGLIGR